MVSVYSTAAHGIVEQPIFKKRNWFLLNHNKVHKIVISFVQRSIDIHEITTVYPVTHKIRTCVHMNTYSHTQDHKAVLKLCLHALDL